MPASIIPAWLIVENASSLFRWRCWKHITAPSNAVAAPSQSNASRRPARCGAVDPANTVQYTRATPYNPSSTITPLKSRQTGVGATAWASASQK